MGIVRKTHKTSSMIRRKHLITSLLGIFLFLQVNAQFSELWGYGFKGGLYDLGFVYKTNNHGGQLRIVHHFPGAEGGQYPNGDLVMGPDGFVYGTASGGEFGLGMIFRIDPDEGELETVYNFETEHPSGSMTLASDGKLYGYTSGVGEIYAFEPISGTYEVLHSFNIDNGKVGITATKMIEVAPNVLYGVTVLGGRDNGGLIFKYDANESSYQIAYEFDGRNGFKPGNIEHFSDGKLYGIAEGGDEFDNGIIFQFDTETNTISTVHEFGESYHLVLDALLEASNGKFYGVASIGGFDTHGAVWEYDPETDVAAFIQEFTFAGGTHIPDAPLMEAYDGNIYGTTRYGGSGAGLGTIFQYNPEEEIFDYVANLNDGFPTGNTLLEVGERTVTAITLSTERSYMEVGEQMQLNLSMDPEEVQGQAVVWSVDQPDIVAISEEGLMTALNQGSVTVTATANKGLGVSDSKSFSVFLEGTVLGLNDENKVNIFPNPTTSGSVKIEGLSQWSSYQITSLSGKVLNARGTTALCGQFF